MYESYVCTGIKWLLADGVYEAAYPLHEVIATCYIVLLPQRNFHTISIFYRCFFGWPTRRTVCWRPEKAWV